MTTKRFGISRRRFIAITAAASALPRAAFARELQTFTWHGVALGAEASLTLQHHDKAEAADAINACLAEVARLEGIFSLFRPDSALQQLNTNGRLEGAPADLRLLLAETLRLSEDTGGAFDPTIQPLWSLYARHFSTQPDALIGPDAHDIAAARRLVDWRRVAIDGSTIRLLDPGMAVTLNGIAQGYITDKVGDLLKARGFEHVLVNMGEQLALGAKWDGSAWQVAITDPVQPGRTIATLPLSSGAIATSGGYGCGFDKAGRFTHILDPETGEPAHNWSSITALAARATTADGLSTALSAAPASEAPRLLGGLARGYVVPSNAATGWWL
jgi:thiamine biosynthesis lipoprotein